jgi:2-polyprenyl-3-methyl-5-hydroxy-6-metoxy-1,4-benzoquinol methylase
MNAPTSARQLDWSPTSHDYLAYRPGYVDAHFSLLKHLGIGLPGQNILDLGTGTGALALPFARQNARVTAADIAPGQIAAARAQAEKEGLDIRFIISPAEDVEVEEKHFDVVSASMCWGYFDKQRIVERVRKVLKPAGLLLISSTSWLSNANQITRGTEEIIARYHPNFKGRSKLRNLDPKPAWSADYFHLKTYHQYIVSLPFTHQSWRGRLRASKWIAAALPESQVKAFDNDLDKLLKRIAPEKFSVDHGVTLQIFELA